MAVFVFCGKLILCSGMLYGYYFLFLRNKRFHHYNRFYLLCASIFSLVIPFLHIPLNFFWGSQEHATLIRTLGVINTNGWEEPVTIYAHHNQWSRLLTLQNTLAVVYFAGALTGVLMLFRAIAYINRLRKKYGFEVIDRLKIHYTTEPGTPFSFFRSIFWDKRIELHNAHGQQIFRHELFHVKEQHSADILLMEILCCIAWFNPFFHLIKKELKAIHEFLADAYAVSGHDRYDYAELLVLHAIRHKAPSISHPFFHHQIKRRITMITQSNLVRRSGYFSRIMALPLLFVLVSAFAIRLTGKTPGKGKAAAKNITVVIDPGHGGIFTGANAGNGVIEKNIDLQIGQKIKSLGAGYNVTVILTRSSDATVGNVADLKQDLINRAAITTDAKPDLFISLHVNTGEKNSPLGTGFEAYISRRIENPKSRQLASSVLASLKTIYTVNETIKQRDEGIIVIDRAACPSLLLECGYINNPADAAFISNDANQEAVARKILAGIVEYAASSIPGTTAVKSTDDNNQISDTLSAVALSKLDVDDIKSISADMTKNLVTVYLKNGSIKYANAKQVNDYYTAQHIEGSLNGYRTAVNIKDSAAEIMFTKDTLPGYTANKIFTKVEVEADYPGWTAYLLKNLVYPKTAIDKEIQGTVVVQFIVDETGKVSDVKAISGPRLLKAESIRIIKESGSWTSATQNGRKVKAYKRQPIIYKLEKQG